MKPVVLNGTSGSKKVHLPTGSEPHIDLSVVALMSVIINSPERQAFVSSTLACEEVLSARNSQAGSTPNRTNYPADAMDEEQKKSPLALLAATCSSIGKSEPTKAKSAECDNNTNQTGKISGSEDTRSSFKPYKQTTESEEMNEKAGFRAPSKESTPNSPVSSVKDERVKIAPSFQYPPIDTRCNHAQSRICGTFLEAGQQVPHSSTPRLHKECSGGCSSYPAPLLPFKGAIPPYPSPSSMLTGQDPTGFNAHGVTTSLPASMYAQCGCGFCAASAQHGESAPAQSALAMNNLAARPLQLHAPGTTPYIDYIHRTICRDANCTNCAKPHVSISPYGGYTAATQQCGPHCVQCDHMKNEQNTSAAAYPCYYPHNLAMFKSSQDDAQPFVCNWVAGSKHCGNSFVTSEDLFQHLRTHTQIGNTAVLSSPSLVQPSCNVHGCPCKLRASPVQSSYHSSRYRPYYFKPASYFPPPPTGCYTASPYQHHGVTTPYDTHRLFK